MVHCSALSTTLELLNAVTEDQRLLSEVMPKKLGRLDAPDRARAQRLCIETLRWADRADRALGMMPREGFGFSRDAPVRMGPPDFEEAAISIGSSPFQQTIRMRYML